MRLMNAAVITLLAIAATLPLTSVARDHGGGGRWGAARSRPTGSWNRSDGWRDNYWDRQGYWSRGYNWNHNFYNYSNGTPSWDTYNLYNYNYSSPYYYPYYYPNSYYPYYYPGSYNPYYYPGRYNAYDYGQPWNY